MDNPLNGMGERRRATTKLSGQREGKGFEKDRVKERGSERNKTRVAPG